MPLIFQKDHDKFDSKIAVWENTEADEFFIDGLGLSEIDLQHIHSLKEHRKKEWLCSRMLVKTLSPDNSYELCKDEFGKPHLVNSTDHISISHSRNRVAVIISKRLVGIDIQMNEEKIDRLQHKFVSDHERSMMDKDHIHSSYHIFWGAKESMYKAYGKRSLEFIAHMRLHAFKYFRKDLELKGSLQKNNLLQRYDIFTDKLDNFFLVYAVLESENTKYLQDDQTVIYK